MPYSVREVAAMLGLKPAQIRSYATQGFLTPDRGPRGELQFGFQDLVVLRAASELTSADIPQRKVRRALQRLREQLPEGRTLAGVRISAIGERVIVRDRDTVWNPESGQELFDFAVDDIATVAEIPRKSTDELDAEDWYDAACHLESTSTDEAVDAYERALLLDPTHADAHINLGRLLHEHGAPAAAELHYRAALESDPRHPIAAFNLGVALEDLGRTNAAIEAYERAIRIDPLNADAHFNLAGILERRGDKAGAVRELKAYARSRADKN
jgi:tetratricopeptide (TPR) repeat protein